MNENTNASANQASMKTFDITDGNTFMAQEFEPLRFAVEKILPHGVFLLAGSGKIGKSCSDSSERDIVTTRHEFYTHTPRKKT